MLQIFWPSLISIYSYRRRSMGALAAFQASFSQNPVGRSKEELPPTNCVDVQPPLDLCKECLDSNESSSKKYLFKLVISKRDTSPLCVSCTQKSAVKHQQRPRSKSDSTTGRFGIDKHWKIDHFCWKKGH